MRRLLARLRVRRILNRAGWPGKHRRVFTDETSLFAKWYVETHGRPKDDE